MADADDDTDASRTFSRRSWFKKRGSEVPRLLLVDQMKKKIGGAYHLMKESWIYSLSSALWDLEQISCGHGRLRGKERARKKASKASDRRREGRRGLTCSAETPFLAK